MRQGTLVSGFQHVAVLTRDLDRLIEFWQQHFDVAEVVVKPIPGSGMRHAMLEIAPGVVLHPFERPEADLEAWGAEILERGPIDHYAVRARDAEAFEQLCARLVGSGASDGAITDFGVGESLHFVDPDGTQLEVFYVREGTSLHDVREPASWATDPARPPTRYWTQVARSHSSDRAGEGRPGSKRFLERQQRR